MNKKCSKCNLANYPTNQTCVRCGSRLPESGEGESRERRPQLARRSLIFSLVCISAVAGFYLSLVFSAKGLDHEQRAAVSDAIDLLDAKGFSREVFVLRRLAVYRSEDNWLNASVDKENAFAATNFPFEIVTIYPDFLIYPADDVERAAILLHEAKHLEGADEKAAYEFVWRNRHKLGWTAETYGGSNVWNEVRKQTRDYAPGLFVCDVNTFNDCTELP
ncbi:MAG: Ran-binding zinc finger domain-containing protein [Pyrinomonadaceae bacterium]